MSFLDRLSEIKDPGVSILDESYDYDSFNRTLGEVDFELFNAINEQADIVNNEMYFKLTSLNESKSTDSVAKTKEAIKEKEEEKRKSYEKMINSFNKLIDSSYNKVYSKIVDLEFQINKNKKVILLGKLKPNKKVRNIPSKILNPDIDILKKLLSTSGKVNITQTVMGSSTTLLSNDLNNKQKVLLNNIDKVKNAIYKNKTTMKQSVSMMANPSNDDISKTRKDIELKVDIYRRLNNAYMKYVKRCSSLLNLYINEYSKSINESVNSSEEEIVDYNLDPNGIAELEDEITEMEYFKDPVIDTVTSMKECIYAYRLGVQNEAIKCKAECINILTEASGYDESQHNAFRNLIHKLWEWLKSFIKNLKYLWQKLKFNALSWVDHYGKWVTKNEKAIMEKADAVTPFKDNVCTWTDYKLLIPNQGIIEKTIDDIMGGNYDTDKRVYNMVYQRFLGNINNTKVRGLMDDKDGKALNVKDVFAKVIGQYRSDPKETTLNKENIKEYINVLKTSSSKIKELNYSLKDSEYDKVASKLETELKVLKSKVENGGDPDKNQLEQIKRKQHILSITKTAMIDMYELNYRIVRDRTQEAYQVLKKVLSMGSSNNESIDSSTPIRNIDTGADVASLIPDISTDDLKIIAVNRLVPKQFIGDNITFVSELDGSTWAYDNKDKILSRLSQLNGSSN